MSLTSAQQKLLRNSPLFEGCHAAHYIPLLQSLEPCTLTRGQSLSESSLPGQSILFLLSGIVEYCTDSGVVFAQYNAPTCFLGALHVNPSMGYLPKIHAYSPLVVYTTISEHDMQNAMRTDSVFAMNLLNLMIEWNKNLQSIACRFSASSPSIRLAMLLLEQRRGETVELSSGVSYLSHVLNISRATLYRSLDELEAANLIRKERKFIQLLDPVQLERLVNDSFSIQT